jgi:hypothetical protein
MKGPPWRVLFYRNATGDKAFQLEYSRQSSTVRARFLSRLRYLVQQPRYQWKPPFYRDLTREGAGLGEIRFKTDRVQQRPLGFHSSESSFVLVIWATEKNNRLNPAGVEFEGLRRKREFIDNPGRYNEFRVG